MKVGSSFWWILVVLAALPALYVTFATYQAGNVWIALATLAVTSIGVFVFLSDAGYPYRYLFPGLLGFGLFVIFPIAYMVFLSFTRYNSQHLLSFERAAALLGRETIPVGNASYRYKLFARGKHRYILYLEDEKEPTKRFESEEFELKPGEEVNGETAAIKLTSLEGEAWPAGAALETGQITREKLFIPMRSKQFVLSDNRLLGMEGLQKFAIRQRLWTLQRDGSWVNSKDGTLAKPDFRRGYFITRQGEKVGIGFRSLSGFENYVTIVTDPRIQGPFFKIFLWTVGFSALSVLATFAVGILLAVVLEWKELDFRGAYRILLILPYAVPAVLSILIFKGLFNQEFGAVNEFLKAMFGSAPEWETNPWSARLMILLVNVWLGYPYMMLVCTGMLQSIPSGIYEASAIDGSNAVIDFFEITLPLVLPPLVPILVSSFAFNFNNFNLIYLLTAGGPKMAGGGIAGETDLLVNYTFNIAFRDSGTNYGLASAIATLLFILVGFLAWINLKLSGKNSRI